MKKLTRIQIATMVAVITYLIWEVLVQRWANSLPESDPVIRIDLLFIIPIISVLVIVSIVQVLRRNKGL